MKPLDRCTLMVCSALLCAAYSSSVFADTTFSHPVLDVTDTDATPNVFVGELSADEQDATIDGTTVHTLIYKDVNGAPYPGTSAGIPVPQIVIDVGDEIVMTLTNDFDNPCSELSCDTSIHWHGIELDADSDGTGVTQNALLYGQTYTYRFLAPRPGVFWFHPHMLPGPQTLAGTYGALIIRDPIEATLISEGKIPSESNTHTLVLSDIEYDGSGDVGLFYADDFDDTTPEVFEKWATLKGMCEGGDTFACRGTNDADTVLVNGVNPAAGVPTIHARSGAGIRLRLINTSTNRYFRLALEDNGADDMTDNNIYRIGGEGGLLEFARLEGGMLGSWDTEYDVGEVLVSTSQRADVVVVPTGAPGDVIRIVGREYHRGGPLGTAPAIGDLVHIVIDNTLPDPNVPFVISNGSEILGSGGVEDVKGEAITDFYEAPIFTGNPGDGAGTTDPEIRLTGQSAGIIGINDVTGHFEHSGPDYTMVPYQDASRYAHTGDLLEFSISNHTAQHHPFHHHGFSFQPVRVIDLNTLTDPDDDVVVYDFNYAEWVDVIDVFDHQEVVVRMRLEDRPRITDNRQEAGAPDPDQFFLSGGAAGRWVFHCHLFLHASIGMISELVVLDTDRDGDGFTTAMDCDDFDDTVNPDALECDLAKDYNCDGVIEGDTTPPSITAPPNVIAECASPAGTAVLLGDPVVEDGCDAMPMVSNDAPALFPLGLTDVTWTATDASGNSDTAVQTVEVVDTTAPDISVELTPTSLWPPNHKLATINATVTVSDTCDPSPTVQLLSIVSNQPDNGTGDGDTPDDIQGATFGTEDYEFELRAERAGTGGARVYTVTYEARDASGNTQTAQATVTVPMNKEP